MALLLEQSVSDCRHLSYVGAALFSAGVSLLIATNTDCISQTCHGEGCRQIGSYAVVDEKSRLHSKPGSCWGTKHKITISEIVKHRSRTGSISEIAIFRQPC